jgi:hypothetical protein
MRELIKFHAPGLAGRLAIVTGVLVALAVGSMYVFGVGSLRGLAEAEALTRVELAASAAREGLRQNTEDLLTAARILGERPPLQRLLRSAIRDALPPYLTRYCEGAGLDACAIVQGSELLAVTTSEIDWQRVLVAAAEQGERFLITGAAEATPVSGAHAAVVEHPGVTVVTIRRMDVQLAARLSERIGLPISIVDYESFRAGEGPLAVINSDALSRGEAVAAYIEPLDAYVASLPVAAATGETIALLQAVLPAGQIMGPVNGIAWRMLLVAIVIAALATAGSVLVGRYWISRHPFRPAAAKSSRYSAIRWRRCVATSST